MFFYISNIYKLYFLQPKICLKSKKTFFKLILYNGDKK